jgi:hypothetical protein
VSEQEQIQVTRTVEATPEQLFALLTSPSRHVELDSANMLRGLEDRDAQIHGVGDQFVMNMNNHLLGDYQVRNTVVAYQENKTIGWAPQLYPPDGYADKIGDMRPGGHTYTWTFEPAGPGQTTVTQTYDWSKVGCPIFRGLFPMLTEEQLGDSIDRASRAAK